MKRIIHVYEEVLFWAIVVSVALFVLTQIETIKRWVSGISPDWVPYTHMIIGVVLFCCMSLLDGFIWYLQRKRIQVVDKEKWLYYDQRSLWMWTIVFISALCIAVAYSYSDSYFVFGIIPVYFQAFLKNQLYSNEKVLIVGNKVYDLTIDEIFYKVCEAEIRLYIHEKKYNIQTGEKMADENIVRILRSNPNLMEI